MAMHKTKQAYTTIKMRKEKHHYGSQPKTQKIVIDDQQDATLRFIYLFIYLFIYSQSALHVSGDVFAHHQEHMTVFTASIQFAYVAAGWCHGRDGTAQHR